MSLIKSLQSRANSSCELCSSNTNLSVFQVEPIRQNDADDHILVCETCKEQIENPEKMDVNHWRCLNESMWSEVPAVQVMAWRLLHRLKAEGWSQDLIDMLYFDKNRLEWAKASEKTESHIEEVIHKDSNGVTLQKGDSVVLIKDLKVKGSSIVAKRGTTVRRISLDSENAEYIEGKINGQQIVIVSKFVKKIY